MPLQPAVDLAERGQFREGEVAAARQHAVPYRADVPVAQEEEVLPAAVHVPLLRIVPEYMEVKGGEEIGAAQGTTGMTALDGMDHADNVPPDLAGDARQFLFGGHGGRGCRCGGWHGIRPHFRDRAKSSRGL